MCRCSHQCTCTLALRAVTIPAKFSPLSGNESLYKETSSEGKLRPALGVLGETDQLWGFMGKKDQLWGFMGKKDQLWEFMGKKDQLWGGGLWGNRPALG